MNFDDIPNPGGERLLSPTKVAPAFRRPLKAFMEEANLAAKSGLKSAVALTPDSLILLLEPGDGGQRASEVHKLLAGPQGELVTPAPKPWR